MDRRAWRQRCRVAGSTHSGWISRTASASTSTAAPEVWPQKGELRLQVLSIERFGLGAHLAALERLKQKLAAEGLFAAERKRPLPRFPRRVGLVTGNDAAAKRDVVASVTARFPPRGSCRRDTRPGAVRGS